VFDSLHAETVARAATIIGAEEFAAEFGVSIETLGLWIRGLSPVPQDVFLRACEVVTQAGVLDAARAPAPKEQPE
jgi:hypothetical protein